MTEKSLFAGNPHHQRLCARGENDGVGADARLNVISDPGPEGVRLDVKALNLGRPQIRTEAVSLSAHVRHQFGTRYSLGETREVLDVGSEHQLPTGLIGRRGRFAFDDDGTKLCARDVDCRGETSRSRADYENTRVLGHGYFLTFSGRR